MQHELSRLQEKQRIQLEAECFEAERRAASTPVFAEGSPTVRFATPVEKVATVADFHSPDMSLGASAGNMNLKTRMAGQTMVINARRRLGKKTTPQPVVDTAAKAEAKPVSRPARRMRSKGPLQTDDLHKSPNPGGDPPYDQAGGDRLADQDAQGSGISNCKQIQAFQGAKITRILSDQGSEFVNQEFETHARLRGIHLATSPAYQPQSNGVAERMVGLAKQCARRLLLESRLPDFYWSYAMRFAAEMLRHKALGFSWNLPAFGEEVGMWRSQDKELIKSAKNRGAIGRLIEVTP